MNLTNKQTKERTNERTIGRSERKKRTHQLAGERAKCFEILVIVFRPNALSHADLLHCR